MQRLSTISKGIPAGLRFALFFLAGFALLGYPANLSLFFAVVGGLCAGLIVQWWNSLEPPQAPAPVATTLKESEDLNTRKPRFTRKVKPRPKSRISRTGFWPFGRDD